MLNQITKKMLKTQENKLRKLIVKQQNYKNQNLIILNINEVLFKIMTIEE